ncbi:predicted protein [Plenodomus lingam JN3]|uniref:Predicted protein n=1 Tax=Leptosphaeria maculans (strain JN3 / isolate v23.1.3 / race Av1-4-5-6-7-8) TaxID=985895 RepID=E4ZJV7_LEPMJ|nr:predicted protein [Plenodomus lingam JN3]CBX91392.1 predicted protein [Plenodomus lingam JN3]
MVGGGVGRWWEARRHGRTLACGFCNSTLDSARLYGTLQGARDLPAPDVALHLISRLQRNKGDLFPVAPSAKGTRSISPSFLSTSSKADACTVTYTYLRLFQPPALWPSTTWAARFQGLQGSQGSQASSIHPKGPTNT